MVSLFLRVQKMVATVSVDKRKSRSPRVLIAALLAAISGFTFGSLAQHRGFDNWVAIKPPSTSSIPAGKQANELARVRRERDQLAARNRQAAEQLQQVQTVLRTQKRRSERLESSLKNVRVAVATHTGKLSSRMNKAIVRNAGSMGSGMIPIFGDAADAAATVVDIAEYCQISRDLDQLNSQIGNTSKHATENDACKAVRNRQSIKWPRFKLPWN